MLRLARAYLQALVDEHVSGLGVGRGAGDCHHAVAVGAALYVLAPVYNNMDRVSG